MIAELCAEERCRILRERIKSLNENIYLDLAERLNEIYLARKGLELAERDLANGR